MSAVLDQIVSPLLTVQAVLNYTIKTGVRPVNFTFDPPHGVPRYGGAIDERPVTIHNARRYRGLTLDVSGFELIGHQSSLGNWETFQNRELVEAIDYPEVTAALERHTGADKVVIFDHRLHDSSVPTGRTDPREIVRRVQDDQTLDSAPRRVTKHLPPGEAEQRLKRRFAIVNFWRPIGATVLQAPLAVCDARTIVMTDLIPSYVVYPGWTGENYAVAFNPRHRWYWHPRQTPSEATLLKIFDSAIDGPARLTAHTAFDDPASPRNAPPRRSIEISAMIFW